MFDLVKAVIKCHFTTVLFAVGALLVCPVTANAAEAPRSGGELVFAVGAHRHPSTVIVKRLSRCSIRSRRTTARCFGSIHRIIQESSATWRKAGRHPKTDLLIPSRFAREFSFTT